MSFQITHVSGAQENVTSIDAVDALVAELAHADLEHPDVSVTDAEGWCLSFTAGGRLTWENLDDHDDEGDDDGYVHERHLQDVERAQGLALLKALASGKRSLVDAQPWEPSG